MNATSLSPRDESVSFDALLGLTSHTFSLAIRLLPQPLRREITLAYLLFRVADTLEDSETWDAAARVHALADFGRLLRETASPWRCPGPGAWATARPTEHEGCLRLLAALPQLLAAVRETPPEARAAIIRHVGGTVDGMIWYQLRSGRPRDLEMVDVEDLRRYSYVVAGVVGELLTDLFALHGALPAGELPALRLHALALGEGFQLVNVLKDVPDDARGGRSFLAPGADPRGLCALARQDLAAAEPYIAALRRARAPRGVVAFLWFTAKLARASLDRVEKDGLGVKMARAEVDGHLTVAHRYCANDVELDAGE